MLSKMLILLLALPAAFGAPDPAAADVAAGKRVFAERCSLCHTAEPGDGGGAQGPSLIGVYGRRSASGSAGYTPAMRAANVRWDGPTLDRFLAAPTVLVPGSSMVVAVTDDAARGDLIAYLQSVHDAKPLDHSAAIPAASSQSANWREDAPGVNHHIRVEALPPPFDTPSSRNHTTVVAQPAHAALAVPQGFRVAPFADELVGPRRMLQAPNGDILVSETSGGKISVLRPAAGNTRVRQREVFASGLDQPFGLAFYPDAVHPQWLYVAETQRVIRYPYRAGELKARAPAEVIVSGLPSGGHFTRDVTFSPDGRQMFVSVGSASNVAEGMPKKTPDEIRAWEGEHGLGAAWESETNRAAVLVFDAARPGSPVIYASGIRNCVNLTVQPGNGALWCTTNERDALGDDLVPDYSTRVVQGGYYGWPWYYFGAHQDPRLKGDRPDLAGKARIPEVPYQAHSAALGMMFYTAGTGRSAFPHEYLGDAIVALHGSWNRSLRTGYKLVRVHMKNGEPVGDYEDFLTGFIVDNDSVWGRPVATLQLRDGSLLMSDDGGNRLWRISYGR